ncbi:MAG: hypothetical protein OEV89_07960 [Desulfobulbaceae bacterium]|nr:hypothetical protein [Desulfobulbaceae bacterium]HIJ90687.1 hypothetical protein [Deltaproteobacteria bacterium]
MGGMARFFLLAVWCCLVVAGAPGSAGGGLQADSSFYSQFQSSQIFSPFGPQTRIAASAPLSGGPEVWRPETVTLPVFGVIRLADFSLPVLAVLLGLADGFNPCAMWALVYLLSLLVSLKDRKKIWFLVGTFVLASGVLYFLFMTAWLNAFILLGYLRPLTLAIGAGALVIGAADLRAFVLTRGAPVCEVGSSNLKKQTMGRMERLAAAPLSLVSFLGVVALAFTVNAIEFVCSAGLPAIFTHTLSLRQLSASQYYGYILLYDFFFMLDDLLIFSLAAFTLRTTMAGGYARYGKLVGGIVLVLLGLLMLFAPEMLR